MPPPSQGQGVARFGSALNHFFLGTSEGYGMLEFSYPSPLIFSIDPASKFARCPHVTRMTLRNRGVFLEATGA